MKYFSGACLYCSQSGRPGSRLTLLTVSVGSPMTKVLEVLLTEQPVFVRVGPPKP